MRSTRLLYGVSLAALGSLLALIVGAGQVPACLGPLGVTAVRCAARGGGVPTDGSWAPMVVASIAVGVLVSIGPPRVVPGLVAGVTGLLVAVLGYFGTRRTVLEGPDYDGTWLAIPLPVDPSMVAWWAIAGALAGVALATIAARLRPRLSRAEIEPANPAP